MVIARFDVFRNPDPRRARAFPFLIVLQSELLDGLDTRVVAPLARSSALSGRSAARLNPVFEIEGETHVMLTQQIGALPAASLTRRVAQMDSKRDAIRDALDLLFTGI